MNIKLVLFFPVLLVAQTVLSQKDYNIWHFSNRHGIAVDFNVFPPQVTDSPISMAESGATICDPKTGSLIMFANDTAVWNSDHHLISNGTGFKGSNSTAQGTLILPHPCGGNRYILFQNDIGESPFTLPDFGLSYSVIDMNLEAGAGEVTEKNIQVSNQLSEAMIAINDTANGYWLICHKIESYEYVIYHIGNDGIPQLKNTLSTNNFVPNPGLGGFCATNDGSRIAFGQRNNAYIELLNFNVTEGLLQSDTTILFDSTDVDPQGAYSVVFSPSGNILYAVDYGHLYQFNLDNKDGFDRNILFRRDTAEGFGSFYALQLASNGQIIVSESASSDTADYIGIIEFPNLYGTDCSFKPFAIPITRSARTIGLPSINKSVYQPGYYRDDFIVDFEVERLDSNTIYLKNTSTNATSSTWELGDGETSNEFSVIHNYADFGEYHIVLTCTNSYGCQITVEKNINIGDLIISSLASTAPVKINIFPNPANEFITIESEEIIQDVKVLSLLGTVELSTINIVANRIEIDVSLLTPQLYFVTWRMNGRTFVHKFIKF